MMHGIGGAFQVKALVIVHPIAVVQRLACGVEGRALSFAVFMRAASFARFCFMQQHAMRRIVTGISC